MVGSFLYITVYCKSSMKQGVTEEQKKEFREVFDLFDKNKNGSICVSELSALMKSLGHTPTGDELAAMIDEMDLNMDSVVDFDEFLILMGRRMQEPLTQEEECRKAFNVFDKTGSGIGKDDLKAVLERLGEKVDGKSIDYLFERADLNTDGVISYEEFKKILYGFQN